MNSLRSMAKWLVGLVKPPSKYDETQRRTYLINTAEEDLMTEDEDDDVPAFKSNKRSHHSCLSCDNSPIFKRRPVSDFSDKPTMAAEGQAKFTKQPEVTTKETQETIEPTKPAQKSATTIRYYDPHNGHDDTEKPEYAFLCRDVSLEDTGYIRHVESFPAGSFGFDVKEPEELSEPSCLKCSETIYTFPYNEEQMPIDFSLTCRCDHLEGQRTQQQNNEDDSVQEDLDTDKFLNHYAVPSTSANLEDVYRMRRIP